MKFQPACTLPCTPAAAAAAPPPVSSYAIPQQNVSQFFYRIQSIDDLQSYAVAQPIPQPFYASPPRVSYPQIGPSYQPPPQSSFPSISPPQIPQVRQGPPISPISQPNPSYSVPE